MSRRGDYPISTPRLHLEPITTAHASALYAGLSDPRLYEFIPEEPPRSEQELHARYQLLERRASRDRSQVWLNWAVRRNVDDHYIGYTQATVEGEVAEIAYVLELGSWGHGYATEAVAHMLDHLHRDWGISTARATVHRSNRRSILLLARLGFVPVRTSGEDVHYEALGGGQRPSTGDATHE